MYLNLERLSHAPRCFFRMAEAVDEEPLFADDLDEYEEEDEEDPPPLPPPVLGVQSTTQPSANSRNAGRDTTPQRNNSTSGRTILIV